MISFWGVYSRAVLINEFSMKNRIIWYMISLILLCTSVKGYAQGIDFFKGTFNEALTKADGREGFPG